MFDRKEASTPDRSDCCKSLRIMQYIQVMACSRINSAETERLLFNILVISPSTNGNGILNYESKTIIIITIRVRGQSKFGEESKQDFSYQFYLLVYPVRIFGQSSQIESPKNSKVKKFRNFRDPREFFIPRKLFSSRSHPDKNKTTT